MKSREIYLQFIYQRQRTDTLRAVKIKKKKVNNQKQARNMKKQFTVKEVQSTFSHLKECSI